MIRTLSPISMGMAKSTRSYIMTRDWSTQSLGRMISEDTTLAADWVADWVGKWNLGPCPARAPAASLICWWIIMTGLA